MFYDVNMKYDAIQLAEYAINAKNVQVMVM